jgi:N-acetylglucosaminyldiphosphoundecaprenol N-acetyl-beta-D-mannosaminyltransferase
MGRTNTDKNTLGVRVCALTREKTLKLIERRLLSGKRTAIFTPNAEMLASAAKDSSICSLLNSSDINIPDGIGIYLASRLCFARLPERSTGIGTAEQILKIAEKHSLRVFLLGGKESVAHKAALSLKKRYPRLIICGTHHGYFDKHNACKENSSVIRSINTAKADILFVCFGFPLQESWIAENLPSLPSLRLAMGLGGSLDVWSGNIRRAPSWVQSIGLEWLWRAFREPKRAKRLLSLPKGLVSAITTKECRS